MTWAIWDGVLISKDEAEQLLRQPRFHAPDSLIETMRWQDHAIQLETWHRKRLLTDMRLLGMLLERGIEGHLFFDGLTKIISKHSQRRSNRIRLQVIPSGTDTSFHFLMTGSELPLPSGPVKACNARNIVRHSYPRGHMKTGDRKLYDVAALTAAQQGWDEALICNEKGHIIESSIANIFWVESGQLFTPPLSEGCVAGVMRAFLLEKLPAAGYQVQEAPLTVERLGAADEVFLSNALRGLRPVVQIDRLKSYESYFCAQLSKLIIPF